MAKYDNKHVPQEERSLSEREITRLCGEGVCPFCLSYMIGEMDRIGI